MRPRTFLLNLATVLPLLALHAQETPANPKTPPAPAPRQERTPPIQGETPMAGSPGNLWDRTDGIGFRDTTLSEILLEASQVQRIEAMDQRYAERIRREGITDRNDARFKELWADRTRELQRILTPVQFNRWQQLNHVARTDPQMPIVQPDSTTAPMPIQEADTVKDDMPVRPLP